jgi:hypothetical protein
MSAALLASCGGGGGSATASGVAGADLVAPGLARLAGTRVRAPAGPASTRIDPRLRDARGPVDVRRGLDQRQGVPAAASNESGLLLLFRRNALIESQIVRAR